MTTTAPERPGPAESRRRGHAHRGRWQPRREPPAHRGREPVAAGSAGDGRARDRGGGRPGGRRRGGGVPGWRCLPARDRGLLLMRIADELAGIGEELARLIASETGNAIRTQARGEAATAADMFRYFGGVAGEQKGETLPLGEDMLSYRVREPLGVVAGIVPWNAPVMLAALKVAMALCTGNTLVLKAAEDAPLGVLQMAEICWQHLPDGVLQGGHGLRRGERRRRCSTTPGSRRSPSPARPRSAGSRCARRPSASCRCRWSSAASRPRSSTRTPATTPRSRTSSRPCASPARASRAPPARGSSCTSAIYDDFARGCRRRWSRWSSATRSTKPRTSARSLSGTQDARVCGYVREALDQGASRAHRRAPGRPRPGYQLPPTVLGGVEPSWRVSREEVFGPVLVAMPWRTRTR